MLHDEGRFPLIPGTTTRTVLHTNMELATEEGSCRQHYPGSAENDTHPDVIARAQSLLGDAKEI